MLDHIEVGRSRVEAEGSGVGGKGEERGQTGLGTGGQRQGDIRPRAGPATIDERALSGGDNHDHGAPGGGCHPDTSDIRAVDSTRCRRRVFIIDIE